MNVTKNLEKKQQNSRKCAFVSWFLLMFENKLYEPQLAMTVHKFSWKISREW